MRAGRISLNVLLLASTCTGLLGITNGITIGKGPAFWVPLAMSFGLAWVACRIIIRTSGQYSKKMANIEPFIIRLNEISENSMKDVPNFVADRKALRTSDPQTGFELISTGGGSDGSRRFKIIGPNSSCAFTAYMVRTPVEYDSPDVSLVPQIWQVCLWDEEWETTIYGALRAYKAVHGHASPAQQYFIRFGPKGALLRA